VNSQKKEASSENKGGGGEIGIRCGVGEASIGVGMYFVA
jgi:hypothetical protein